jgi:tryptophan 2,3-dioxygenase
MLYFVCEIFSNLRHGVCAVYELWFKQILKELESVISLLKDHDSLPIAVRRLERATLILEVTKM